MATVTSAGPGYWSDGWTWVGGSVPDLSVDDVIIKSDHDIELDIDVTLGYGRQITIEADGDLEVDGGSLTTDFGSSVNVCGYLMIYNSSMNASGDINVMAGGDMSVHFGTELIVDSGGILTVDAGGKFLSLGNTLLVYGSYGVFFGEAEIVGTLACSDNALLHVSGSILSFGQIELAYDCTAIVVGDVQFAGSGSLSLVHSDVEVLGSLKFMYGTDLYLGIDSRMQVWGELAMGALIFSEGGQIRIMRREVRLDDSAERPMILFDKAYGHGTTLIA